MYFNTNDKYITPEEVADELGLSLTTVYNLLRKGQLPGVKVLRHERCNSHVLWH